MEHHHHHSTPITINDTPNISESIVITHNMDHGNDQGGMDHDMHMNGTMDMMKMYFHIGYESVPFFFGNWILNSDSSKFQICNWIF